MEKNSQIDLFGDKMGFWSEKWLRSYTIRPVLVGNMYYFLLIVLFLERKHDLDRWRPFVSLVEGQKTKKRSKNSQKSLFLSQNDTFSYIRTQPLHDQAYITAFKFHYQVLLSLLVSWPRSYAWPSRSRKYDFFTLSHFAAN